MSDFKADTVGAVTPQFDPDGWHDCPWCGVVTRLQLIHGHYACLNCHRSVHDCCDGIMQQ